MGRVDSNLNPIEEVRKILDQAHLLVGEQGKLNLQKIMDIGDRSERASVIHMLDWIWAKCNSLLLNANAQSNFNKILQYATHKNSSSLTGGFVLLKYHSQMFNDPVQAQNMFNLLFKSDDHAKNAEQICNAWIDSNYPGNEIPRDLIVNNPTHALHYAQAFKKPDVFLLFAGINGKEIAKFISNYMNDEDNIDFDLFLMSQPSDKKHIPSDSKHIYLYWNDSEIIKSYWYYKDMKHYILLEDKLLQNANFNLQPNNLIKCNNKKLIKAVVDRVTSVHYPYNFTQDIFANMFDVLLYLNHYRLLEGEQGKRNLEMYSKVTRFTGKICTMLKCVHEYKIVNQNNFTQLMRYAGKLDEIERYFLEDIKKSTPNSAFNNSLVKMKQLHLDELTYVRMASNTANKNSAIKNSIVPLTGLIAEFTGMPGLTLFPKKKVAPSLSIMPNLKQKSGLLT